MAGAALFFVLMFVLVVVWATFKLRQMWARLTGKPLVQPFSAGRFDPRYGFQQAYSTVRKGRGQPASTTARAQLDDVTDVVPRTPSQPD
ncbi:hypothetical protein E9531_00175 [Lampropedia puyangensis]|uniref:Uncharacterized protein n=2 Tax=Lampropedia puyangensis TaxID=1330072 RepID=A0A4S8FDA8_9BURK|nr:hypothetical protein E9531_00175 [Lampropedia puyangensis]